MSNFINKLKELDACEDAVNWASGFETFQEAWDSCKRSDWMLWLINEKGWLSDKELRLFAVRCARDVQHLMTDKRSINALDVAERYASGRATEEELSAAWAAAWAAACDSARAAACDSARAAAWAAAWAAACDSARAAAWDSARATERDAAWAKQCDYIREILPSPNF